MKVVEWNFRWNEWMITGERGNSAGIVSKEETSRRQEGSGGKGRRSTLGVRPTLDGIRETPLYWLYWFPNKVYGRAKTQLDGVLVFSTAVTGHRQFTHNNISLWGCVQWQQETRLVEALLRPSEGKHDPDVKTRSWGSLEPYGTFQMWTSQSH